MAYNFGLRLMSLSNTGNIEDLYNIMEANLKPLYDKNYYPVKDKDLFRDFIERLTDRYYSRYLNFNTYGELYIKLKYVLENNKQKYLKIYEAGLIKIEPLITYRDKEEIKEDYTLKGNSEGTASGTGSSSFTGSGGNTSSTHGNENGYNNLSFENRQDKNILSFTGRKDSAVTSFDNRYDKTEFTPTGTEKVIGKNISAYTSNPKTYESIPDELSDLKYIDNEQLGESSQTTSYTNRKDTTKTDKHGQEKNDLTKTGTETNTYDKTGKEKTDFNTDSDTTSSGTYNDTNSTSTENTSTTKDESTNIKDGLITRIKEGFSGNQMELIKMYSQLVFDLNNEIINDINDAKLFMSTLA